MARPEESGFIILEYKMAPNQPKNRVCAPTTWIRLRIGETKVGFVYPPGDEESAAVRIQNREPADPTWKLCIGDIKFEAGKIFQAKF